MDRQGFIRAVVAISGPQEPASARPAPTGQRETTITCLAVLKAAAEFAASRPHLESNKVVKIAPSWERWVIRDAVDDDTSA